MLDPWTSSRQHKQNSIYSFIIFLNVQVQVGCHKSTEQSVCVCVCVCVCVLFVCVVFGDQSALTASRVAARAEICSKLEYLQGNPQRAQRWQYTLNRITWLYHAARRGISWYLPRWGGGGGEADGSDLKPLSWKTLELNPQPETVDVLWDVSYFTFVFASENISASVTVIILWPVTSVFTSLIFTDWIIEHV